MVVWVPPLIFSRAISPTWQFSTLIEWHGGGGIGINILDLFFFVWFLKDRIIRILPWDFNFFSDHLQQIQDMLGEILLMVEILHQWDKLPIYWLVGFPPIYSITFRIGAAASIRLVKTCFFFPMIKLIFLGGFKPSITPWVLGPQKHIFHIFKSIVGWNSMSNPLWHKISKDAVPVARHTIAWSQSEEDLTLRVLVETWLMGSFDRSDMVWAKKSEVNGMTGPPKNIPTLVIYRVCMIHITHGSYTFIRGIIS